MKKPTAAARASLFGGFQLLAADGREITISNRRARALLAMLCLAPDEPIDRDHVSRLLWPGRFETQARASLRQCLLGLGKALTAADCHLLDISRTRIGLNAETVETDLAALERALAAQQYAAAADLLMVIGAKPLLDQMHFGNAFDTWLEGHRRQTEQRLHSIIAEALSRLERSDDASNHAQLRDAWLIRNPESNLSGEKADYSVAVIPLESADDKNAISLADDVSQDLVAMLSRAPHLSVAAFDISLRSKLEQSGLAEIGRSLGVQYIVSGSIAQRDDQLLMRISLVNAAANAHIMSWRLNADSKGFRARLDDFILDLSTPILSEIQIAAASTAHLRGNSDGFEVIQSTEMLHSLYSERRANEITVHLTDLIAREPDNAAAKASLAMQIAQNVINGWTKAPDAASAQARSLIETALAIAPNDPDVLMADGIVAAMQFDPQSAIHQLSRSLEINPNNPHTLAVLGWQKTMLHGNEEGLEMVRAAERRAPHHPRYSVWAAYRAMCEVKLGRLERSAMAYQDAIARNPNFYPPHLHYPAWLALLKRDDEARAAIHRCLDMFPHFTLQDYRHDIKKWEYMLPDGLTLQDCIAAMSRVWPTEKDRAETSIAAASSNALAAAHSAASGIAARDDGKIRLAVLPFRSMASPDDQGFLADGIVDELITTLSQVPALLVAGRTSSFSFKGSQESLPAIAAALNVTHLVEGSVQRQGEHIRVNVSLADARTGFDIWSYSYDGSVEHIFVTRADVGKAVNDGIAQALNLPGQPAKVRILSNNREAYGLYLQGRALTLRAIGEGVLTTAITLLEQALDIDPEFAECWTALAEAEINVTVYTPCTNRLERTAKAADYACKAIALAPAQGHARIVLAFHEWTKNNIVGALDLAFEAYQLEPNNPEVVNRLGSFLLYIGRCEQALPYIQASIEQDPVNGRAYTMLSAVHLNLGNIDKAIAAGERIADLGFPTLSLAQAIAAKGDNALAVETYQLARQLMNTVIFPPAGTSPMAPEAMEAYWLLAAKGLWSGDPQDRANYCQVLDMLHATLVDPCDATVVWPAIWMGYTDMVFKTLGTQITTSNFFGFASLWNDFEPTRQTRLHPDFLSFAQRIGLVAAWDKYGWPDLLPEPSPTN